MKKLFLIFIGFIIVNVHLSAVDCHAAPRGRPAASGGVRAAVKSAPAAEEPDDEDDAPAVAAAVEPEEEDAEIENKSDSFAEQFGFASGKSFGNETPLQRSIREQKEKLGLAAKADAQQQKIKNAQAKIGKDTAVECDESLRKCMAGKCGGVNFDKCFNDADTDWGMKMDSCRRNTKCTGREYAAISAEINEDRKQNYELAGFQEIIKCGKMYNACIRDMCGNDEYSRCVERNGSAASCKDFAKSYEKCWPKSGGDKAVAACEKVYKKCQEFDSGLPGRAMEVFGGLRVELEKNISKWEQELYDLRDSMSNMCMDGMFDQRSLHCVYTVELFADKGGESTLMASRKLHGDSTYTCNPDEFGIDITTFKENAYRLTRSQTAASNAALGAGVGVAAGALSSGAIGRALDVAKTAGAAKEANANPADAAAETAAEGAANTEGDAAAGGGAGGAGDGGAANPPEANAEPHQTELPAGSEPVNETPAPATTTTQEAEVGQTPQTPPPEIPTESPPETTQQVTAQSQQSVNNIPASFTIPQPASPPAPAPAATPPAAAAPAVDNRQVNFDAAKAKLQKARSGFKLCEGIIVSSDAKYVNDCSGLTKPETTNRWDEYASGMISAAEYNKANSVSPAKPNGVERGCKKDDNPQKFECIALARSVEI